MSEVRIAWFSPFPPVKTGIAGRSAEIVDVLRVRGYTIDTYPEERAHDFPWRHRLEPYDLVVHQFGNSSHHDYQWPYALRYPGLVVLHDTHLHHARAALLLRERRADDYRTEFRWSEPDVSPDAAEIAIAGFDSALYYEWTFVRSLIEASRLVAVHGQGARQDLIETLPRGRIASIRLGEGVLVSAEREVRARRDVRARYGIAQDAVLFGCFGGLTPEKRLTQIVAAYRALQPYAPNARLLLAGAAASHFEVKAGGDVTLTGFLETDDELTDHIAACDVTLNLRWPTARETSGPWLRALAAQKATVITDLAHLADVPSLDPRTWRTTDHGPRDTDPVCVAIDILDEDHSLRLAMRRLATDGDLRTRLGRAAREYWARTHSVEGMADDYESAFARCASLGEMAGFGGNANDVPHHLRPTGDEKLRDLLRPFGLESPL
jgi:glycosyltransferase involved in cell wall biosynthesis